MPLREETLSSFTSAYKDELSSSSIVKTASPKKVQRRVLILCHPRLVTGTFEPLVLNDHWWGSDENGSPYRESLRPHGMTGEPTFDTVDIKKGGTYTADAFNDSFNNQHIEEYDLIIAPDCGGVWYTHQESSDDNARTN
jgi:hypothetical protein